MQRRLGFVKTYKTYLSIEEAASAVEWRRGEMLDAIQLGIVPVFRLGTGQTVVPMAAIAGWNQRLNEHD